MPLLGCRAAGGASSPWTPTLELATRCLPPCRWGIKPDGHRSPSVRALVKPLLGLFHGEPGCKRWKNAVDALLKADPATVGE